jgi:intraflagellar transport protein 172
MNFKHVKTVQQAQAGFNKISALAFSPNHLRLATVSATKIVYLYDENGDLKDKFPTKPADSAVDSFFYFLLTFLSFFFPFSLHPDGAPFFFLCFSWQNPKPYVVRALAFSPDSTRLAIAQSDDMVFVYKLGSKWGEKKSITNKFQQTSSVTCLCWPSNHVNELFFGLADGKVKMGNLRTNKSVVIYSTEEYLVSLCCNSEGTTLLGGHLDGTIYLFSVSATGTVTKVCICLFVCLFVFLCLFFLGSILIFFLPHCRPN